MAAGSLKRFSRESFNSNHDLVRSRISDVRSMQPAALTHLTGLNPRPADTLGSRF